MKLDQSLIDELVVAPGRAAGLADRSTRATTLSRLGSAGKHRKDVAAEDLESFIAELKTAQERLWASDEIALLVILQAMDAAGKDGTIKHVMTGVNPQGCRVVSFKQPTPEEQDHNFLWRYSKQLPERGQIGIFNRSYYEDVLVVRVHPELLPLTRQTGGDPSSRHFWKQRFEDINAFEHHLHRNGTHIVKVFLHLSPEEQKRRLLARLDDPAKQWKFSASDLAERERWDDYQQAYEKAITATSTKWAPWYVVPADHKYALRALVGGILVDVVDRLDLRFPTPTAEGTAAIAAARKTLEAE